MGMTGGDDATAADAPHAVVTAAAPPLSAPAAGALAAATAAVDTVAPSPAASIDDAAGAADACGARTRIVRVG